MYYVGIDWSDEKHDLCILAENGEVHSKFKISNDQCGFDILRKRLTRLKSKARINIEQADGLLANWLVRQGEAVYLTPPVVMHHRRPLCSKTDKSDPYLLAHLLCYRRYRMPSPGTARRSGGISASITAGI